MTGTPAEEDPAETTTSPRAPLSDEAAETIVVDRELDAETLVVDRTDESTIVVERTDEAAETIVVDRSGGVDRTVVVPRDRPAPRAAAPLGRGRRRRGMTMPPVEPGYGRGEVVAAGPGAVATYVPRAIPDPPAPPAVYPGVEATRVADLAMPSVRRRSRRTAIVALALFAAACVVSVVGLVAVALAVFR